MPRTTITPNTPVGPYPTLQPAANTLDLVWTAADVANQNQATFNGPKLILARNSHASIDYTVTFTSKVDNRNRAGDITTYNLNFGDTMAFKIDNSEGWLQSDGFIYFGASNASVLFAVLNL
jgi:hypothetical protein